MHTSTSSRPPGRARVHTLPVRLTHWVNAYAMGCMFMSGWGIYNASPIFGFSFPEWATLGGWLGAATIWHFAVMWLLVANGLLYLLASLFDGHLRRDLLSVRGADIRRDMAAALRLRLDHRAGRYNAVQKAMYLGVLLLGLLLVLSGLAIWKPVQLQGLTALFGGFAAARVVHFIAMAGVALFVVVHVSMVLLVPRTLPPMITGRAPRHVPEGGRDA
ncbi:cytochrome b/b6 domain-containing protein [Achromobacter aloeverae]|uniref:Thioredoxin reductase n=1 Tax=Achromobacter aloeverae TaxID=1750518 RepID=A0A4Q1HD84_9BURK|nr:cytochrome b/b6 domain-containing protein [Achromobacter aloeverae]RXN83846.1 thioredoxin reductase [Achromobacter aloeverae]